MIISRWQKIVRQLLLSGVMLVPTTAWAVEQLGAKSQSNVASFLKFSGYSDSGTPESPVTLVGAGISMFLSLFGLIFLVLMVYAGVKWMTAAGNNEQVDEAKGTIRNAAIGLAIVLLAYVLTYTVIRLLGRGGGFQTGVDSGGTFPWP